MNLFHIILLGLVQGAAELLPVSSSAHVIVATRLLGLDPSTPEMTFLIVMLHTGTMLAVILYFWKRWAALLSGADQCRNFVKQVAVATVLTGVVGLGLKLVIEKVIFERMMGHAHGEVEHLCKNLPLIAAALFGVGVLILIAARKELAASASGAVLDTRSSVRIGIVQGLCLPFRGFSRSGATISTGLLVGIPRMLSEDFSFALAVVLTPPVIVLELRRLMKATKLAGAPLHLGELLTPGLLGMVFSFGAGLLALRWLSAWLECGKWHYFGYYCVAASVGVGAMAALGF